MKNILSLIDKAAGKWLDYRTEWRIKNDSEMSNIFFHDISINKSGMETTIVSPAIAVMADEAASMLDASNAKNYIQFDMLPRVDRGLRPIRVTVQFANGEAPAEKSARLEKENSLLQKHIKYLEERIEEIPYE